MKRAPTPFSIKVILLAVLDPKTLLSAKRMLAKTWGQSMKRTLTPSFRVPHASNVRAISDGSRQKKGAE